MGLLTQGRSSPKRNSDILAGEYFNKLQRYLMLGFDE
jgi:hypothetical protein